MDATTILIIALVGAGVLVAAGVFAVAWRRGPNAAPIVGKFDRAAAKRDMSTPAETDEAPAAEMETAPEPVSLRDERTPISAEELGVTRRKFLNRAAYGLFVGGFLGPLGLQTLDFMWPRLSGGFGTKVSLGRLNDLRSQVVPGDGSINPVFIPEAQAWIVPMEEDEIPGSSFEGLPVIVGTEGGNTGLMAMWQKCVHLGCRVPDCPSSSGFECPCHGSKYNYHGEYEGGPAPRNLDRFVVSVDDAGNMVADTGAVIETPRSTHKTIAYPQGPSCL